MKAFLSVAIIFSLIIGGTAFADQDGDDKKLLDYIHKYGITKCDDFILENSRLKNNWHFSIQKHVDGIDGLATEVSIIRIFGGKNDTLKIDDSYIQTQKNCYLHQRATLTFAGPCSSSINGDAWYVFDEMADTDYTKYKNKNGLEMLAKEISVGNFKACVHEHSIRSSQQHS